MIVPAIMRVTARRAVVIAALSYLLLPGAAAVSAQEHVSLQGSVLFYGDNTEFRAFRDGATLFGAAIRLFGAVKLNDRVTVRLGAAGNHRFGADKDFELVAPVVALVVQQGPSTFVFGTLETTDVRVPAGPDRGGPHGLLPALQRETLSFDRPYEAGLQWRFETARARHEAWINWQQVNTPAHRERFDAGLSTDWRAAGRLAVLFQGHVVHHGGQLFASGAVSDSYALAPGLALRGSNGRLKHIGVEAFAVASRFVPDRASPDRSRSGVGVFTRGEASTANWRGHVIVWRGNDYLKEEGDANYLNLRMDGRRYRGVRDYSEAGVARWFRPARGLTVEVSARFYRIEPHNYEYSYRVLALVNVAATN
jgi:hypothetical protein